MWNLIISTIVFFIAAWIVGHYLDGHDVPKGMTRTTLVFVLASLVSWGAGEGVDWAQGKTDRPQAATQTSDDLSQLLREVGQSQQ